MTYQLRNTFRFGAVTYPLPTGTGNDLIQDADPAIAYILLFLQTVINKYCGASWTERVAIAGLTDATGALIASPCMQLVPFHGADYFQDEQFKFPMLSLDRVHGEYKEISRAYFEAQTKMQLLYILPPVTPQQAYQILPFRKMVRDTILDRLMLDFDPSWLDGETPLYKTAGFDKLELLTEDWLPLNHPKTNQIYETYMMTFTLMERKNDVPGAFPHLDNVDGYVSGNGVNISDFKLNLP